jgi:hypothetical protein
MKQRLFVQFLVVLMVGFLSAKVGAQVTVPPEKFVFVKSIGSPPPPTAQSSQFNVPSGVAVGTSLVASGYRARTFYVADPLNNQVVVFGCVLVSSTCVYDTATSTLSTLSCPICTWEDTSPFIWTLNQPTFVATAPNGNIWIGDTGNDVVVEVNPNSGTVVAFAGAGPIPAGTIICSSGSTSPQCLVPGHPNQGQANGKFFAPGPLAVDKSGNLYVADGAGGLLLGWGLGVTVPYGNIRIQKFASDGTFSSSWGSWCDLNRPSSYENGYYCQTVPGGQFELGDGQLAFVTGLAFDDSADFLYVADQVNNRVQVFSSVGTMWGKWGGLPDGSGDGQFNGPGGIAVDPLDHSIYVVDQGNDRIQQFDLVTDQQQSSCPSNRYCARFLSKGGSNGAFEAQFNHAFGIATEPLGFAQTCQGAGATDCIHGFVVSEQAANGNKRVQLLAARTDNDNDGITDEIDTNPSAFSNDFSDASLGFTTFGSIVNRGDQTFVIYNLLIPSPQDEIRVRTETFGGPTPLQLTLCATKITLSFPAGTGANMHCSTPTVVVEEGPVGVQFVGSDNTGVGTTLITGDSLSVDVNTSKISINRNGSNFVFFADMTPPATIATGAPRTPALCSAYFNTCPPNLTINKAAVIPGGALGLTNCWINNRVTLIATDNAGGSRVKQISYSLSGARPAAGIFVGNQGSIGATGAGTLRYFATDNAGNQETPKVLDIFGTPSGAYVSGTWRPIACTAAPTFTLPAHGTVVLDGILTVNGQTFPYSNDFNF